ncbi:unnamed protein product [Closterium sp. Naga37s-1]|nr:unnamed protein product [Closterium sp. Naga37s-1]
MSSSVLCFTVAPFFPFLYQPPLSLTLLSQPPLLSHPPLSPSSLTLLSQPPLLSHPPLSTSSPLSPSSLNLLSQPPLLSHPPLSTSSPLSPSSLSLRARPPTAAQAVVGGRAGDRRAPDPVQCAPYAISISSEAPSECSLCRFVLLSPLNHCCRYAAVFAAFITATAATVGIDFAANFAATLATRFEALYEADEADEALGLRNRTMLLAAGKMGDHVFKDYAVCHVAPSPSPSPRLLNSAIRRSCGLALRAVDPVAMKEFILSVQSKAADIPLLLPPLPHPSTTYLPMPACGLALRADDPVAMKEFILAVQSKAADIRKQAQEAQSEAAPASGGAKAAAPVLSKRVGAVQRPEAGGLGLSVVPSAMPSLAQLPSVTIAHITNNRPLVPPPALPLVPPLYHPSTPSLPSPPLPKHQEVGPWEVQEGQGEQGWGEATSHANPFFSSQPPTSQVEIMLETITDIKNNRAPRVEFMLETITDIKNNRAPHATCPPVYCPSCRPFIALPSTPQAFIICTPSPQSNVLQVEFMLETITDIKNNRAPRNAGRRGGSGTMGGTGGAGGTVMGGGGAAVGGGAAGKGKGKGAVSVFTKGGGAEASDGSTAVSRLQKWLLKRPVEIVQLRSLTWQRLIDPHKHGQWWHSSSSSQPLGSLPATSAALGGSSGSASLAVQLAGNALLDAADVAEAERLMQLAAAQRMNTDARRAVFCVIMSAEDYIDAFEKLLRLGLPGKQDREILRVLVECCMQERHFNKYYSLLAARLCGHARSHKFSLQYCLWDHYQQLPDMDPRRSLHLAQFAAQIVGNHALSLALLKPVDFADPAAMHARIATHFRLFFLFLLSSFPPATLWSIFSRIAAPTTLGPLRDGILLFFAAHLSPHAPSTRQLLQYIRSEGGSEGGGAAAGVAKGGEEEKVLEERFRLAKKGIANIAGTPYK